MPDPSAFAPALFRFLRDLRKNNDREWFLAHKDVYERDVNEPALAFISAFAAPLRKISPHLVADARPIGGSLFRIYRDVRFSNDKRPYKTHVGIHFRHRSAGDAHAPGFYLHLEPGSPIAVIRVGPGLMLFAEQARFKELCDRLAELLSKSGPSEAGLVGGVAAIIANQEKIIANQEKILANQEKILAK